MCAAKTGREDERTVRGKFRDVPFRGDKHFCIRSRTLRGNKKGAPSAGAPTSLGKPPNPVRKPDRVREPHFRPRDLSAKILSRSSGSRSPYSRALPPYGSGMLRFRHDYSSGAAPDFNRIPFAEIRRIGSLKSLHYLTVFFNVLTRYPAKNFNLSA